MKVPSIRYDYNKNIQFQSNRQGWDKLKVLLANPDGAKYGHHPINYDYEKVITETNALPTFNKPHFEYADYQNLSPKERRIIGILNRKGTFNQDNCYNHIIRDNKSINRDAERVLRMAVTTKEKLDKEYKNGYKLVGIGRSPAVIVETMSLLGADAVAIPFSQHALRYPKQHYNEYKDFSVKDWEKYFKYFGVDKTFSQRTGKTLIFTDYINVGITKELIESILQELGFDNEKTKFTGIIKLMPRKKVLLPNDFALSDCFMHRIFSAYSRIENLAAIIKDTNIVKYPELYETLPETFLSKLFRCALYDLLKEKKLNIIR